ncbi:MAG TPA: gliding motility-associated C-terminal domain-containing protein, partial [Bacteroidia bacterium]|nr:gliding motility-associated C-terminal domain-containing protein [Bacteroidia bacterium]
IGENNVFYIKTENVTGWSTIIYDRWGKEMFNTTNPDIFWDGNTEGGSKAPDGVYYYIIKGNCQGATYNKDGFVQLIR